MSIQPINSYSFRNIFKLDVIEFDKACVINNNEQIDSYRIYWIKKGKGTYNIDFESFSFKDNVLFFLSPGQIFSVNSEKINEAYKLSFIRDFYCIETHDKEIACNGVLFNNIYETPFVKVSERDSSKLNFILESLIEEFNNSNTAQYDMLQSYLKQFIIHSVRMKKDNELVIKNEVASKLFKDFSTLVEKNFNNMHSVTDYANRLGVSPKSLAKHFQLMGVIKPSEFIKNRIILEAKRQLIFSSESVKHIAFSLGFNDPAYFTRYFTKAVEKSPLQFKKEYKE